MARPAVASTMNPDSTGYTLPSTVVAWYDQVRSGDLFVSVLMKDAAQAGQLERWLEGLRAVPCRWSTACSRQQWALAGLAQLAILMASVFRFVSNFHAARPRRARVM